MSCALKYTKTIPPIPYWECDGDGGGLKRILAATLTYSGTPTTRPNSAFSAGTGTLPDPATILPGGTIKSVQYSVTTQIDFQLDIGYLSLGVVNDARIPFYIIVGGIEYVANRAISITASSTFQSTGLQQNINYPRVLETFTIPTTGSTPGMSIRIGEPNYGRQTGTGYVGQSFEVSSFAFDATVEVYYIYE